MQCVYKCTDTLTHIYSYTEHNSAQQRVVTGGLSDAAQHGGPLGLCMQLCGGTHHRLLLQGFGPAPHVVSPMVAPSIHSPKVHTRLRWICAMSKSSTQYLP